MAQCKRTIEDLEQQNLAISSSRDSLEADLRLALTEKETLTKELHQVRQRLNIAQQNWVKEREESEYVEQQLRGEVEIARKSVQDWEVLAMEESSVRRALSERCAELEEQLLVQKEAYEALVQQNVKNSSSVEALQRALADLQESTLFCWL